MTYISRSNYRALYLVDYFVYIHVYIHVYIYVGQYDRCLTPYTGIFMMMCGM